MISLEGSKEGMGEMLREKLPQVTRTAAQKHRKRMEVTPPG